MRIIGFLALALIVVYYGVDLLGPTSADIGQHRQRKSQQADASYPFHNRSLTIDEAYGRIPHKRTAFDSNAGHMPADEARYLGELFNVVDRAVVERVHLQGDLAGNRFVEAETVNYDSLLSDIKSLATPDKLFEVEALVYEAVAEQAKYLEAWRQSHNSRYYTPRHGLVQSSHKKLIAAYDILMRLYPAESSHNKTAFFDHLCALDFV